MDRRQNWSTGLTAHSRKSGNNTVLRSTLYESLCDGTLTKAEYQGMKVEYDRKAMELEGELNRLQEERHEYMRGFLPGKNGLLP